MSEAPAVWLAPDELEPWSENPNRGDVDAVAASIERFGFGAPIVARSEDRRIIAGHHRWLAAKQLGMERVPVRFLDLSAQEAAALALADNQLSRVGHWLDDQLGQVLHDLDAQAVDLTGLGWSDDELRRLMGQEDPKGGPAPDSGPLPAAPDSRPGLVYQLGPHRLACGDCTDPDTIAALMGDDVADIVLTDPPYCSGGFQEAGRTAGSTTATTGATIARDNLTTEGLEALLEKGIGRQRASGCAYVFCDWRQVFAVRRAVEPLGYQYRSLLIWDKGTPGMGGPWRHQYEAVYFGTRRKEPPTGKSGDVLRFARSGNAHHTTEKPLDLLVAILENTVGDAVVDPFGGSGATLLACAIADRRCFTIEVSPAYCDVIRQRWTTWALENGRDPGPGALQPAGDE